MRRLAIGFFIVVILQGCTVVKREAGYPGGNVGYLADRHTIFSKGQEQQVNRYLISLALLAPLIAETVETSGEAKLSAERIKTLYKNIEKLEAASQRCTLPKLSRKPNLSEINLSQDCSEDTAANKNGTALGFESLSFDVNKSLNDALKQAFDNLKIRSNASRVLKLDPTEMLKTLVKARHLVPVLLRYLSSYRDVSIVFGFSVAESCNRHQSASDAQEAVVAATKALEKANNLKSSVENKADTIDAAKIALTAAKEVQGSAPKVSNANVKKQCQDVADSFGVLLSRTRTVDSDIARQERPISQVFIAGENALNVGLDWQLTKTHRISLLQHVNRACAKLDALARIDDTGFDGCTVALISSAPAVVAKVVPKNPDPGTQSAVKGIIDNGS